MADPFGGIRSVLHQLHLWLALTLCLPLIAIGLTGSILAFQNELGDLFDPMPRLAAEAGKPHTVTEMLAAAQARVGQDFTPIHFEAPRAPDLPARVGLIAFRGDARQTRVIGVLIDPVSLDLIPWHHTPLPRILRVVLEIHGNLLLDRGGRAYVGWLGVAMLLLGTSGLVLWWPRRGRWRPAFLVSRGARGLRLYRELHGAVGIWMLVVFIAISCSGVYIAFPATVGGAVKALLPSRDTGGAMPTLQDKGAPRIDPDHAIAAALAAAPGTRLLGIFLPLRPTQAYRVVMAHRGDERGAPDMAAIINPWSGAVIEVVDPARFAPAETVLSWLRVVHFTHGLGVGWRFLVFLSGLLPALFAVTGVAMWLIKRSTRRRSGRATAPPIAR